MNKNTTTHDTQTVIFKTNFSYIINLENILILNKTNETTLTFRNNCCGQEGMLVAERKFS